MSIVLITDNSSKGLVLANLIVRADLELKLVVVEDTSMKEQASRSFGGSLLGVFAPPIKWLSSRVKFSRSEREALRYEQESIVKANRLVDDYINSLGVTGRPAGVEYLETPSLNEATVVTAVKNAQPEICVVLGVSNIKQRITDIPKIGTINAHTSILPEYRGAGSEFWQCYNEDYRNVGITYHFVDTGLEDSGKILYQWKQDVDENPEPNLLRANNSIAKLKNYVAVIESVLGGTVQLKDLGQGTTPTYKYRDITEDKRIKLYTRIVSKNGKG